MKDSSYLIAQISGKQFFVKPGEWFDLDFIKDVKSGDFVTVNKILFLKKEKKIQIGKPFLGENNFLVKILQQVKGPKVTVLKTKPKKKYTRTKGQRQKYTRVQIET